MLAECSRDAARLVAHLAPTSPAACRTSRCHARDRRHRDKITPVRQSREIAVLIPNATEEFDERGTC
jgi:hypothetical protein